MRTAETSALRVLLACDNLIRYEIGLAQGLRANGCETVLLGRDHDHAFGDEPGAMRRYLESRLGPEQPFVRVPGRVRDPQGWVSLPRTRRQIRQLNPDVTHVQYCLSLDPRLTFAARLRPRRYAVTVHDFGLHPGDVTGPFHHALLQRRLLRNAGLVFVHADHIRDKILDEKAVNAPVVVVPLGIDGGVPLEGADPQPLPREPSLLFFGRIREYKGLAVLLDALVRLWGRRPETTLTVAGEGPLPRHPALADERVRLLHRHISDEELPRLFAATSLVVLPYLHASQSGVGVLAKGYGRPLVASAVGGLPELLSDGSGVLVPPGDATRLADAIGRLLDDRPGLERMGNAGLRTLQEHAGWPAVADVTLEAYARYLGTSRARVAGRGARALA